MCLGQFKKWSIYHNYKLNKQKKSKCIQMHMNSASNLWQYSHYAIECVFFICVSHSYLQPNKQNHNSFLSFLFKIIHFAQICFEQNKRLEHFFFGSNVQTKSFGCLNKLCNCRKIHFYDKLPFFDLKLK